MLLLSAVVLVASICLTSSRPEGAPAGACINLTPDHPGTTPQAGDGPYVFNLDQFDVNGTLTYTPGETYRLVLSDPSTSNAQTFRGFLVQARVVADSATVGVGTFAVVNSARSRPSFCTPTDSAITHINTATPRVEFESMVMDWTAPPEGTGPIQFAYAVVQQFITYWPDQRSATLEEGPVTTVATTTDSATVVGVSVLFLLLSVLGAVALL